jgi:tetratricopeptide (TPR) repeat protein
VGRDLVKVLGAKDAPAAERRLLDAGAALERGRARDAIRMARPLVKLAPDVAAVREVAGMASYRLGNWTVAAEHLEAFVRLSGSTDLHPMLADCYRAVKRYRRAGEVWDELRRASPSAAVVTEGRIVAAGALADQGRLSEAIALLERGPVKKRRAPSDHHLRLWYALADLYERAGDTVRARELFARVAEFDPDLADTAERLGSLG